jgi:hypothetical protein
VENRTTRTIDAPADPACRDRLDPSRRARLGKLACCRGAASRSHHRGGKEPVSIYLARKRAIPLAAPRFPALDLVPGACGHRRCSLCLPSPRGTDLAPGDWYVMALPRTWKSANGKACKALVTRLPRWKETRRAKAISADRPWSAFRLRICAWRSSRRIASLWPVRRIGNGSKWAKPRDEIHRPVTIEYNEPTRGVLRTPSIAFAGVCETMHGIDKAPPAPPP